MRRGPARSARGSQPPLDLALHVLAGAPHVNGQRGDGHGGDDGQRPLQPLLVGGMIEKVAAGGADRERGDDAPVDGLDELRTAGLAKVGEADGDDEEGLDALRAA